MARRLTQTGLLDKIYVGSEDNVFPGDELEEAIGIDDVVERIEGIGHALMSSEAGIDHMAKVVKLAKGE